MKPPKPKVPPQSPKRQWNPKGPHQANLSASCGHTLLEKNCPVCKQKQHTNNQVITNQPPSNVIEISTDKKSIQVLVDKIKIKLSTEKLSARKAATILSHWLSKR